MSVRRWIVAAAITLVAIAAAAIVLRAAASGTGSHEGEASTALATVERRSLSSQQLVEGTLGFGGSLAVANQAKGIFTKLPAAGQVVGRGELLYRVENRAVVLLFGPVTSFRTLKRGMSGSDVRELNANLVRLGYAGADELGLSPASKQFGLKTEAALESFQEDIGVAGSGELALGQAVFAPGPLRITKVMATAGSTAAPGATVAEATSTEHQILVELDAAQQGSVHAGEQVQVTLPSGDIVPGTVSKVGKVAAEGAESGPTVPVYITPHKLKQAGDLDEAPVQVRITTARVEQALVVPVTALLALAGGGYAVEVAGSHGHHLVAVTTGIFDDAEGLVQVKGTKLKAGQRVAVPST